MLAFVGDLVDRGPRILDACMIAMHTQAAGRALAVPGNHDDKLHRWLKNHKVEIAHGLQNSVAEIEAQPAETRPLLQEALLSLPHQLVGWQARLAEPRQCYVLCENKAGLIG